jgi:hypothetical protein
VLTHLFSNVRAQLPVAVRLRKLADLIAGNPAGICKIEKDLFDRHQRGTNARGASEK